MKKVILETQDAIVTAYKFGYTYTQIQHHFGVNRWNVQDALHKAGVVTNRINSPPRIKGGVGNKKKKKKDGRLMDRYLNDEFIIDYHPCPTKDNNPVIEADLDIMERIDENCKEEEEEFTEIIVDRKGRIKYEQNGN